MSPSFTVRVVADLAPPAAVFAVTDDAGRRWACVALPADDGSFDAPFLPSFLALSALAGAGWRGACCSVTGCASRDDLPRLLAAAPPTDPIDF